jgi:transcriptional regulator with XRE-family HTH domain
MSRQLDIRKIIGRCIAKKRDQVGLTQEEVAHRLNMSTEGYARYERGTAAVELTKLAKIAAVYKCDVAELVVETSNAPSAQARRIANLLEHLTTKDRDEVVSIVEKICLLAHQKYNKN